MSRLDRLPEAVWPSEKNVGGHHLTLRYALVPLLLTVAAGTLAGYLPGVTGSTAIAVAALVGVGAAVSLVEARTRKCPGYAVLGIDTCPLPDREAAGPPARGEEAT